MFFANFMNFYLRLKHDIGKKGYNMLQLKRFIKRAAVFISLALLVLGIPYMARDDKTTNECRPFPHHWHFSNVSNIIREIIEHGSTNTKPINNIYNKFRIVRDFRCSMETLLTIVVKSYSANVQQRHTIRKTWGSCKNKQVQIVFLLGYSKTEIDIVKNEFIEYKDIIQGSFEDIYKNNIFKTHMAYDWIKSKCFLSKWVFFVDDDYFVNIPNLLQFTHAKAGFDENALYGYKQCNKSPVRLDGKFLKWYISEEEYPYTIMPPFLSGGSILAPINVVKKLRLAFPFSKRIWLDDVFISLVAIQLNISLIHEPKFVNTENRVLDVKNILSSHLYNTTKYLYEGWLLLNSRNAIGRIISDKKQSNCFEENFNLKE